MICYAFLQNFTNLTSFNNTVSVKLCFKDALNLLYCNNVLYVFIIKQF